MPSTTSRGATTASFNQSTRKRVPGLTAKSIANGTLRRAWDTATSPYQRLLATGMLAGLLRTALDTRFAQTNPLALRGAIHDDLAKLWRIPAVMPLAAD